MNAKLLNVPTKDYVNFKQAEVDRKRIAESAKAWYNEFYAKVKAEGINFGETTKIYMGRLTECWKGDRIAVAEATRKLLEVDGWLNVKYEIEKFDAFSCSNSVCWYLYVTRPDDDRQACMNF